MIREISKSKTGDQHTFKDPHRSREIVAPACAANSSGHDRCRWHKIIGKGVVQVTLYKSVYAGDILSLLAAHTWSSNTSVTVSNSFSYL